MDIDTPCQNSGYRYWLLEMWDPFRCRLSYGILVKERMHAWKLVYDYNGGAFLQQQV